MARTVGAKNNMTPYTFPKLTPDLPTLLDMKLRDMLASLNCNKVGTIESFDTTKQTATVKINIKLQVGSTVKDFPLLADVPVFVLGGGDRVFTFPVRKGDTCLVLFSDRDIDNWFTTGGAELPSSPRLHDLSDGMALVGFRSLANPVDSYSSTDCQARNGQSVLSIGEKISLKNANTDLLSAMNAILTALTALDGKSGPSAAGQIANAQTLIQQLLKT